MSSNQTKEITTPRSTSFKAIPSTAISAGAELSEYHLTSSSACRALMSPFQSLTIVMDQLDLFRRMIKRAQSICNEWEQRAAAK